MKFLYPTFLKGRAAVALLVLRIVSGLGMMVHGWGKIQNPTSWNQGDMPGFLQALAAVGEFGGGLGLLLGLLTPLAALGVMCTMAGAYILVHSGDPWIASKPGTKSWESASLYFIPALAIFLAGPGSISLDALIFGKKR